MALLVGIDVGTSGAKTVLFNEKGQTFMSVTVEYPLHTPKNGYAEQDPEDWKNAVLRGIREVTFTADALEIEAVGLTGQMHGLVMLDKDGKVIRPAMIWCDQRTEKQAAELTEKVGAKRLLEITANPAVTGFTAAKLLWIMENEPQNYEKCAHILLPKDYIRYVLTGEFATEMSDASGTQLLDVANRCWSDEVLSKLGIDKALLPKLYESPEITGRITRAGVRLTGLIEGTPVVGGAGDNAAAAVGTGIVRDGRAFTTIGSSGVVYAHTKSMKLDPLGRVHTFCSAVPNEWHVMGVTQGAGLSLKWFRDNFCGAEMEEAERLDVDPYSLTDKQAEAVPIGSNGLMFLPYLNGERTPHLDPNARGVFFGLSAMHKKPDFIRAIMEGVSFSLRDCLEILREMGIDPSSMPICGGGGSSPLWRKMLADVFGCKVTTVYNKEGPALGAALLAGVGTGVYGSVPEACRVAVRKYKLQPPDAENTAQYEKLYERYRSLYPALKPLFNLK